MKKFLSIFASSLVIGGCLHCSTCASEVPSISSIRRMFEEQDRREQEEEQQYIDFINWFVSQRRAGVEQFINATNVMINRINEIIDEHEPCKFRDDLRHQIEIINRLNPTEQTEFINLGAQRYTHIVVAMGLSAIMAQTGDYQRAFNNFLGAIIHN